MRRHRHFNAKSAGTIVFRQRNFELGSVLCSADYLNLSSVPDLVQLLPYKAVGGDELERPFLGLPGKNSYVDVRKE